MWSRYLDAGLNLRTWLPNHFVLLKQTTADNVEIDLSGASNDSYGSFLEPPQVNTKSVNLDTNDDTNKKEFVSVITDEKKAKEKKTNLGTCSNIFELFTCNENESMSDFEIKHKEKNEVANDTDELGEVNSNHSTSKKIDFNEKVNSKVPLTSTPKRTIAVDKERKIEDVLPFDEFFNTKDVIKVLGKNGQSHTSIPRGQKENKYFIVKMERNDARVKQGSRRIFHDDCGAWIKSSYCKSLYLKENLFQIYYTNKKYAKKISGGGYAVLTPQPMISEICSVTRYTSRNKKNSCYKRRVSWLDDSNECLVKYIGKFSGLMPHGNSVNNSNSYMRALPQLMEEIEKQILLKPNKSVYDELIQKAENAFEGPRNLHQIHNKKYTARHRLTDDGERKPHGKNYGDELLQVISMAQYDDFVCKIIHSKNNCASIILFTDQQIEDIRRFCVSGEVVLSIDKTYNLGKISVTITVFKNLSILGQQSKSHPLFLGPVFLHGRSDTKTYFEFFSCINMELKCSSYERFIVGIDDEVALHLAVLKAFPDCEHVLCTRHLEQNLRHYLQAKIGTSAMLASALTDATFAILDAKDSTEFEGKKKLNKNLSRKMSRCS